MFCSSAYTCYSVLFYFTAYYTVLFYRIPFHLLPVSTIVIIICSGVCAVVVVLSKSCSFEMFALRAEEISATDDFTIVTKTFLFITELDDPRGVCK